VTATGREAEPAGDGRDDHEKLFVLELGQALGQAGAGTEQLEETMTAVAERIGLVKPQVFVRPTSMTMATGPLGGQQTMTLRVAPGEVDLARLTRLTEVAVAVHRGALSLDAAIDRVRAINLRTSSYPFVLRTAAYILASASIAFVLGGGIKDAAAAGFVGLTTGVVALAESSAGFGALVAPTVGAVAGFFGPAISVWAHGVSPGLITLAGIVVFLPGVALTVGLRELATGQLLSGTGNLSVAATTLLGLVFGTALGSGVGERWVGVAVPSSPGPAAVWVAVAAAVLAGLSLTVQDKAEPRDAAWMVVASVTAIVAARWLTELAGSTGGAFLAALTVGIAGNLFSRLTSRPSLIFVAPGLVMLVPGSAGYRSLSHLLDAHVDRAIQSGFDMFIIAIALVYGLLLSNLVLRPRPFR
jgi:uncharacterized membrane protein YjjP (DUF1212 family)